MIARVAAFLLVLAVAACGSGAGKPPAPPGVLFSANFRDADPVDFANPKPSRFAVHGIDAARFQTSIDWNTARANGVNFAFLKATEGGDLLDPAFKDHWRRSGQAAVLRGAYHFYYFCTTPEVQARWFIRNVPRSKGTLPPVLDMEWNPFSPTCAKVRPPAAEVQRQMRVWLDIVEAHYGQRPVIYTTPRFYEENRLGQFKGYEFWLRTTAKTPREAYPGQRWRFWQYSATGLIPGIRGKVDLNAFNGSRDDWQAWVARNTR
ncbi:Glycoside hydrolase, family 25 [Sulfitobacter noctilucicola]|uniref:Lysozyme n=1 Tax=Sulfitobacter noctilucicola TaxID=1342301 RepID=A0A7W6M9E0_9RHOB|nr:GH25 family lysozyme [Sulfitobacter noctilucicola]KIN63621.1 Glycoside hydrolase, family 25 [Sulfitobacter noctilucicola]MBB4174868.1 lysozyme [Sulfitobacter noctilucicola]